MSCLQPIDWFSLAILLQLKTIHQSIQLAERNHSSPTEHYSLLQSLLLLSVHLIFNPNRNHLIHFHQLQSIIHQKLNHLPQLTIQNILRATHHSLQFALDPSPDALYLFSNQLHSLISTSNSLSDRPTEFHPQSPIGLYVRSCRLDISSLEFDQLSAMAIQLRSFFNSNLPILSTPTTLPPTDPILEAFLDFSDSYAMDFNKASNSLRRYYDIRSSNSNHYYSKTSHPSASNHQQALLSLSKFHLTMEAYPAALDALEEAARLARLAGDRSTLDKCASLRRRIIYFSGFETNVAESNGTTKEGGGILGLMGPTQAHASLQSLRNLGAPQDDEGDDHQWTNAARNGNHGKSKADRNNHWSFWDSNEEMFSVYMAISLGAEPINHLHARLFRANRMKINDHNNNNNNNLEDSSGERTGLCQSKPSQFDQVSWFALQAKLWDLQGQVGLCEIYEDLALEFFEGESNRQEQVFIQKDTFELISKSDVICHRALRLSKNGQFYEALLLMCQLIIENQSNAKSFRFIHQTVLEIFQIEAKHQDDQHLLSSLHTFQPHALTSPSLQQNIKPTSVQKQIEKLYDQAETFIHQGNHHAALCPIVSAIVQSEKMNLKKEQSKGIVLWANVILHLDPTSAEEETSSSDGILRRLGQMVDLPDLETNYLLKIQLFWILVRTKIHILFTTFPDLLQPRHQLDRLSDEIFQIFDLFNLINILYEKREDLEGKKKAIAYQLIIIEEIQLRSKLERQKKDEDDNNDDCTKQEEDENEAIDKNFLLKEIDELKIDLIQKWNELFTISTSTKSKKLSLGSNQILSSSTSSTLQNSHNNDNNIIKNHENLLNWFLLVKNLTTVASVLRHI